jgi:hypothetical protein
MGKLTKRKNHTFVGNNNLDMTVIVQMPDTSYLTIRKDLEARQQGEIIYGQESAKDRLKKIAVLFDPDNQIVSLQTSRGSQFPIEIKDNNPVLSNFPDYKPNGQKPTIGQLANFANIISFIANNPGRPLNKINKFEVQDGGKSLGSDVK